MNLKILSLLSFFIAYSAQASIIHPDWDETDKNNPPYMNVWHPEAYQATFSFEEQIKKAGELRTKVGGLMLVIGGSNKEDSLYQEMQRFGRDAVHCNFDGRVLDPRGSPHFYINVHNLASLKKIPDEFFERIVFDRATLYQLDMKCAHLNELARMLMAGGLLYLHANFMGKYMEVISAQKVSLIIQEILMASAKLISLYNVHK
jgi:hypothetical protein